MTYSDMSRALQNKVPVEHDEQTAQVLRLKTFASIDRRVSGCISALAERTCPTAESQMRSDGKSSLAYGYGTMRQSCSNFVKPPGGLLTPPKRMDTLVKIDPFRFPIARQFT
jgi:hypothetical protein